MKFSDVVQTINKRAPEWRAKAPVCPSTEKKKKAEKTRKVVTRSPKRLRVDSASDKSAGDEDFDLSDTGVFPLPPVTPNKAPSSGKSPSSCEVWAPGPIGPSLSTEPNHSNQWNQEYYSSWQAWQSWNWQQQQQQPQQQQLSSNDYPTYQNLP
ncbi:uncharacterized protein LOC127749619 [Frankliniella occidentalis]|uniref:Uncharacterized protein LOC127749619 n=1 Tax=Frankliniella occidentalis TaxID=133901 RepID=A0A9C6WQD1_FRAOC|nr:uncharacterized protein LOC127749619 [Frankliniella occidentalis]